MGVGHPQLPAHGSEGLTVHVPPFIHKLGTTVYTLIGRWRNLKTCSTACRHTRRAAGWAVRTTPQQYSACMTNAGQIWTVAGVNPVKCLHASAHFNNFVPTVCQLPVVPAPVPAPAPTRSPAAIPALLWSLLPVTVFWLAHSWSIFCFYATAVATLAECGQEGVNGPRGRGWAFTTTFWPHV